MVTGERKYENVIAVAEYAPDDYVLKPYTATELENRIVLATQKKHELSDILLPLDRDEFRKAVTACDKRLESNSKSHRLYVMRVRAETYAVLEEFEKAAAAFEEILKTSSAPWAEL